MTDLRRTPLRRLLLLSAMMGGASLVKDTATGNPVTFETDVAKPLVSLIANFLPIQSGTGDPSPTNVRPITGWDAVNVGQINGIVPDISNNSGMEKVNGQWQNASTDGKTRFDAYIQLYKGSTYIKGAGSKSITSSGVYSITFNVDDENCNRIVFLHSGSSNNLSVKFPFELPQGTYTINFNVVSANPSVVGGLAIKDIFLVEGSEVERTVYPTSFPSTIYGGYRNLITGEVWATWLAYTFTGEEQMGIGSYSGTGGVRINSSVIDSIVPKYGTGMSNKAAKEASVPSQITRLGFRVSSGTSLLAFFVPDSMFDGDATVDKFKSWLSDNGLMICVELESPVLITTLTPTQITALIGNNTVWSDANGNLEVTYMKKG